MKYEFVVKESEYINSTQILKVDNEDVTRSILRIIDVVNYDDHSGSRMAIIEVKIKDVPELIKALQAALFIEN